MSPRWSVREFLELPDAKVYVVRRVPVWVLRVEAAKAARGLK